MRTEAALCAARCDVQRRWGMGAGRKPVLVHRCVHKPCVTLAGRLADCHSTRVRARHLWLSRTGCCKLGPPRARVACTWLGQVDLP